MGIDRIGKGGAPPAAPEAPGVEKKGSVEKPFAVDRPVATRAAGAATSIDAASPLARLRAGEIDVDGYVDLKVDEATRGLEGLSPNDLGEIKKVLRDQLVTDPELAELVRSATGKTPTLDDG